MNCERYWRKSNVKQAASIPLMSDGNWTDAEPFETDEPPPHENFWWEPNANEMKRVCINRHNGGGNIV